MKSLIYKLQWHSAFLLPRSNSISFLYSLNQPIIQSIQLAAKKTIHPTTNQATKPPTNQPTNQPTNPPTNQPTIPVLKSPRVLLHHWEQLSIRKIMWGKRKRWMQPRTLRPCGTHPRPPGHSDRVLSIIKNIRTKPLSAGQHVVTRTSLAICTFVKLPHKRQLWIPKQSESDCHGSN